MSISPKLFAMMSMAPLGTVETGGMDSDLIRLGYMRYADTKRFLELLVPGVVDGIFIACPYGLDDQLRQRFDARQYAVSKRRSRLVTSFRDYLRAIRERMEWEDVRAPLYVHMGPLTGDESRIDVAGGQISEYSDRWNRESMRFFDDAAYDCVQGLLDQDGRPLCQISVDGSGGRSCRSLEWRAQLFLDSISFGTATEGRPSSPFLPWNQPDIRAFTTMESATRFTPDSLWASLRNPHCILITNEGWEDENTVSHPWTIAQMAAHVAAGRDIGIAHSAWYPAGDRPALWHQIIAEAARQQAA